jgi:hypothetical protein
MCVAVWLVVSTQLSAALSLSVQSACSSVGVSDRRHGRVAGSSSQAGREQDVWLCSSCSTSRAVVVGGWCSLSLPR